MSGQNTRRRVGPVARITGFLLLLGAIFAVAGVAGARIDPDVNEASGHNEMEETQMTATIESTPPGLAVESHGYRIDPVESSLPRAGGATVAFRILGPDGDPVTDFDVEHERRMHLIVIRRDFAGFQHLHPDLGADGTWTATADLSAAGVYRAFADFSTAGESLTLATDLFVPGEFDPAPLPAPATVADAGDGYRVELSRSGEAGLAFKVTKNGEPVGSVQPYLGADGHLVALREHDQAFLHVHPLGDPGGSGPIRFEAHFPSPGRYRLFLQFKHADRVHTAAFTTVSEAGSGGEAAGHAGEEEHSDGGH